MKLIRKTMKWFNLSVTDEMRRNYDNGCSNSEKEWLLVECERDMDGGDQVGFSCCFCAMIAYATFCICAIVDCCLFAVGMWFFGTLLALFGVLCFAIPGIDNKPYYISESTYRRVLELD